MAISDYLAKLVELKNQLVANLTVKGVDAQQSEKLNTLVPKVLEVPSPDIKIALDQPSTVSGYDTLSLASVCERVESVIIPPDSTITKISIDDYYILDNCEEFRINTTTPMTITHLFRANSITSSVAPSISKTIKKLTLQCGQTDSGNSTTGALGGVSSVEELSYQPRTDKTTADSLFGMTPTNLKEIHFLDGVLSISCNYSSCTALENITIADSVKDIRSSTSFSGTPIHDSQTTPMKSIDHWIVTADVTDENCIIPDGTVGLKESIFKSNTTIKSITIPSSLKYFGYIEGNSSAQTIFNSALESVTMPEMIDCKKIPPYTFYGCKNLSSITIPDNVETIGWSAFYNCAALTSINIPSSVTSIGSSAFYNCASLTSVTLPNKATFTSLGSYAFCNCTSLQSINIPSGITQINSYTFSGCTSLDEVVLHDNVKLCGSYAFSNCTNAVIKLGKNTVMKEATVFKNVKCVCPATGSSATSRAYAPWGAKQVHEYDENGVCIHCGHAAKIIFSEATSSDWTSSGIWTDDSTYGRKYSLPSSTKSGTTYTVSIPFTVRETIDFPCKAVFPKFYYTADQMSYKIYDVDNKINKLSWFNCGNNSSWSASYTKTETVTLEPGNYTITCYYTYKYTTQSPYPYFYVPLYLSLI